MNIQPPLVRVLATWLLRPYLEPDVPASSALSELRLSCLPAFTRVVSAEGVEAQALSWLRHPPRAAWFTLRGGAAAAPPYAKPGRGRASSKPALHMAQRCF